MAGKIIHGAFGYRVRPVIPRGHPLRAEGFALAVYDVIIDLAELRDDGLQVTPNSQKIIAEALVRRGHPAEETTREKIRGAVRKLIKYEVIQEVPDYDATSHKPQNNPGATAEQPRFNRTTLLISASIKDLPKKGNRESTAPQPQLPHNSTALQPLLRDIEIRDRELFLNSIEENATHSSPPAVQGSLIDTPTIRKSRKVATKDAEHRQPVWYQGQEATATKAAMGAACLEAKGVPLVSTGKDWIALAKVLPQLGDVDRDRFLAAWILYCQEETSAYFGISNFAYGGKITSYLQRVKGNGYRANQPNGADTGNRVRTAEGKLW